jgi:hypothetical protein
MGWQVLIQPMSILEFWPCPTTIEMHEKEFKNLHKLEQHWMQAHGNP